MQTPEEYWLNQLNYCASLLNELTEDATEIERKALLDEIQHATEQLKAIVEGNYKEPALGFVVLDLKK